MVISSLIGAMIDVERLTLFNPSYRYYLSEHSLLILATKDNAS